MSTNDWLTPPTPPSPPAVVGPSEFTEDIDHYIYWLQVILSIGIDRLDLIVSSSYLLDSSDISFEASLSPLNPFLSLTPPLLVSSDTSSSCVFELSHDVAVNAPLPRPTTTTTSSYTPERNPTAVRPREDFYHIIKLEEIRLDPHRRETPLLPPAWETLQLLQSAETLLHLNESLQQHEVHQKLIS